MNAIVALPVTVHDSMIGMLKELEVRSNILFQMWTTGMITQTLYEKHKGEYTRLVSQLRLYLMLEEALTDESFAKLEKEVKSCNESMHMCLRIVLGKAKQLMDCEA